MSRRRRRNGAILGTVGGILALLCLLVTVASHVELPFPFPTWDQIFDGTGLKESRPVIGADVEGGITVHVIDVGQGESILIKTDSGNVLIDAGENDQGPTVMDYLQSQGVETIDYFVGTHPHSDHIGGMDYIIEHMDVKEVVMSDIPDSILPTTKTFQDVLAAVQKKNLEITVVEPGDSFDLGPVHFAVLAPIKAYDDLNDVSVVLKMTYGERSFLFPGDAEKTSEKDMASSGKDLSADVLVAGHHGSRTSSSNAFLDKVNPAYVAISCGKDNSYGHPHKETLENLETRKIAVNRTDEEGSIIYLTDGKNIAVQTEKAA
ncbi:ComEC/Rec2 family competence protein [Zongyangia hominis]|uniref:MBL fold metallo-hydrolase n=1 Tax=Zongyangia hominis TaxID=2763677 RepID=A0A926ED96_9FIRM|nr:ComEC/Rec2 family competence protein [Zongyangia hominis]MBC8570955.1 MBL fold metallo-hydrolase [Zongyangia hominis]